MLVTIMATATEPRFPVLLQLVPQPRWQRSLIPMESLSAIEESGDPPGWIAEDGYRVIDSDGNVFNAAYQDEKYSFTASGQSVSDADLRALMLSNLKSLRHPTSEYRSRSQELTGAELYTFTLRWAKRLPDMSPQLRAFGCTAIILLCLLAAGIPIALVWWLWWLLT